MKPILGFNLYIFFATVQLVLFKSPNQPSLSFYIIYYMFIFKIYLFVLIPVVQLVL